MKRFMEDLKKRMHPQKMLLYGIIGCLGLLQSCASTHTAMTSQTSLTPSSNYPLLKSEDIVKHQQPFQSSLPFGIGARFDLFIADTTSGFSDAYQTYVAPLRKGKIFSRQPYQIDYSLFPKKGEAFNTKNSLIDSIAMKSDYKVQVGMSRKFHDFSDFFNPAFWLALGKYADVIPVSESYSNSTEIPFMSTFKKDSILDLNQPADLNVEAFLRERWGLESPREE